MHRGRLADLRGFGAYISNSRSITVHHGWSSAKLGNLGASAVVVSPRKHLDDLALGSVDIHGFDRDASSYLLAGGFLLGSLCMQLQAEKAERAERTEDGRGWQRMAGVAGNGNYLPTIAASAKTRTAFMVTESIETVEDVGCLVMSVVE